MIDKQKFLIVYIIIGYSISLCSSQSTPTPPSVTKCSKWNTSSKKIIFGQENRTAGNNDYSLNLLNSGLGINRQTDEIAVLDDNNHRVLVFNRSNTSTLFAILSDSSNVTNNSMIRYSTSAIAHDRNNSIYILDNWQQQKIMKMKNPLEYGQNASLFTGSIYWTGNSQFNSTAVGLCVDNAGKSVLISDYDRHQIINYNGSTSIDINYGTGTAGNASDQLNNPTSIVMDNNRTLFVNDVGNNRIQMFKYNSRNGTTLPTSISGCIGLSLYMPDILVMNTKTAVYLFNLTNNETTCVIGCDGLELNDTHNALIDKDGNLIITDSNQVLSYSIYHECPNVTDKPMNKTPDSGAFTPNTDCPIGKFGINCTSSENICNVSQPCLNSGLCFENKTNKYGYSCDCPWGFNGINCEDDQRPCKPFTCFERGNCTNTSMTEFKCQCIRGYEGDRCGKTVDFCGNVTCQNRAVCFSKFLNYTCNCLMGYSGRHCETADTSTVVRGYVTKSFGYVAIIMLTSLVGFFVVMDVLKYGFGIDPVQSDRDALRKKHMQQLKKKNKVQRPKVIQRFHYVS